MKKLFIFLFMALFPFSAISAPTNIPDVLITDINNPNWIDVRRFADIEPGLTALANKTATLRITKDVTLDNTYGLGDYSGVTVHIMPGFTCTITNAATYGFNVVVEDQGILAIDSNITIGGNLTVKGNPDTSIVKVTGNEVLTVSGIYNKNVDISHKILHVAGISALRLTVPIKDGEVRYLDYHTTMGDGGDGNVIWDADNVSTDNSGTIIQVTGITTGRWIRQLSGFVTPEMFGAKGDGITDDTLNIEKALLAYSVVVFKENAVYMINADRRGVTIPQVYGVNVQSNSKLIFQPGATLRAIPNALDSYRVLNIQTKQNVVIEGGIFEGDKDEHLGITGEGGHAIAIYSSENVHITGAQGNNGWGVGLAMINNKDVWINDCTFDNNRQNGGAMASGENIWVNNVEFSNTSGTAPSSGFDIEPNANTDYLKNIHFTNVKTTDNDGAGFTVALAQLKDGTSEVDITIENHVDVGSIYGVNIGKLNESTLTIGPSGHVTFIDSYEKYSGTGGIFIQNYAAATTPTVNFVRPKIYNCNVNALTLSQFASGIILLRQSVEPETYLIGNVNIINPDIYDDRTVHLMRFGIYISDEKGFDAANVRIEDPLRLIGTYTTGIAYMGRTLPGVTLRDTYKIFSGDASGTTTMSAQRMYTNMTTSGGALINFNLATSITDSEITFTDTNNAGIRLTPEITAKILPISTVAGKYITTGAGTKGSSVTIKKLSATEYVITKMVGTWTVAP